MAKVKFYLPSSSTGPTTSILIWTTMMMRITTARQSIDKNNQLKNYTRSKQVVAAVV